MNASLHERTTKKFHLREFEVVAGCKVHLQTYACTVMSFLVLKEQGKSFMLIADRINHVRICTVTLLAAFRSNN